MHAIRDARPDLEASTGTQLWVTGAAAANIDITEKLADAFPLFLLIVVGLAIVLLLVAFRSLLVPVTAVLGFLLTIAAAFGATTAVFQWGWLSRVFNVDSTGPLLSFLPILLVGVLFGLAMDYQVFLVSRMREEHVHGADPTPAVRLGFAHGARVVLAAALIMISVFSSFVFSGSAQIGPIAFALAIGILFDALVVRMTMIPAAMTLLGQVGLVAAALARPDHPERRHRGCRARQDRRATRPPLPSTRCRRTRTRAPTPRTGCTPPSDATRAGAPRRTPALARRARAQLTSSSTQSKVLVTAFFQWRYCRSRSSSSIDGSQRLSSAQLSMTSCSPFQKPTARPAA